MKYMKMIALAATLFIFSATTVMGQETPKFCKDTYPEHALKSRLEAE